MIEYPVAVGNCIVFRFSNSHMHCTIMGKYCVTLTIYLSVLAIMVIRHNYSFISETNSGHIVI